MFTYYVVFMVLSLILMFMVLSAPLPLQFTIMAALVAGFGMILYNDGGVIGEKAVTMSELNVKRRREGHSVDSDNERVGFHKKTALTALLVAAAPLLFVSVVNAAYEPLYRKQLDAYVEQYGPIENQSVKEAEPITLENGNPVYPADTSGAALFENPPPPINYVMIVTRVIFSPFIVFATLLEGNLGVYNILLVLFSFIMPAFGALGYLNGPRFHKKKLDAIKKGVRSKMRKMKRERNNRQMKEPKREV